MVLWQKVSHLNPDKTELQISAENVNQPIFYANHLSSQCNSKAKTAPANCARLWFDWFTAPGVNLCNQSICEYDTEREGNKDNTSLAELSWINKGLNSGQWFVCLRRHAQSKQAAVLSIRVNTARENEGARQEWSGRPNNWFTNVILGFRKLNFINFNINRS